MGTRGTGPCSPLPPEGPGSPGADLLPPGAALAHPSCPLRVVGRELLPTRPWAGAAPTAILSTWLAEALVTSGHQDRGTSLTPSTLRRQPGRGQKGKTLYPFFRGCSCRSRPCLLFLLLLHLFLPLGWPYTLGVPCAAVARPGGVPGHGTARHGTWAVAGSWAVGSASCPFPRTSGPSLSPRTEDGKRPALGFGSCCSLWPAGMLTCRCPQPDQDEDLPVGCGDPAGEGQRGWEGAPAAAEEETCRLVLSTPSSILRDREIDEVRHPPACTGTPPSCSSAPYPQPCPLSYQELVQCEARWVTSPCAWGQSPQQHPLGGKMLGEPSQEGLQGEDT